MNKKLLVGALVFVGLSLTSFKADETVDVNWLTFEEAVEKLKTEKKKVFIDVYTDWCGWCKVMDKNTFSQPIIAQYLNENFYPVKLDAEQKEDITFNGVTYKFVPSGRNGYHQLAAALLQNKLSYPQFVILNEKMEIINITAGYQKPEPFHKIISFYNEDSYVSKEEAAKFEKEYKSPFSE
ncbi:thioredoxin family protein [Fulvivirga lutea]|uniref:DUF255 domain-containing protein n=1 Tax=Fulvivirga lutea TaxID=2810512 RepID=A0A974WIT4_9BACT|nr:DUF255 domain-containing protein [Fulvivirga lutea]QSE96935.1 DUF255 domain-containing protein [Fulvivirga lutea]